MVNKSENSLSGMIWTKRLKKIILPQVLPSFQYICQANLNVIDENREIRNIVEYCGKKIKSLKRKSFGPFNLNNVKLGEIREIPQKVLENKLKSLGLKVEDYFR